MVVKGQCPVYQERKGRQGKDSEERMARKRREGQRGKDSEERMARKGRLGV